MIENYPSLDQITIEKLNPPIMVAQKGRAASSQN